MGIFSTIKKEVYINKLVEPYCLFYASGDMEAIRILRENYSVNELKIIVSIIEKNIKNMLKQSKSIGWSVPDKKTLIMQALVKENPFKESRRF